MPFLTKPNFLKLEKPNSVLHIMYPTCFPPISAIMNASGSSANKHS